MWVKTQNGKTLVTVNRFLVTKYGNDDVVMGYASIGSDGLILGLYSTEERATQVLDDITKTVSRYKGFSQTDIIFKMPKD